MSTSSGEFDKADRSRIDPAARQSGSPLEGRSDSWRVIRADGPRLDAAEGEDETAASPRDARPQSRPLAVRAPHVFDDATDEIEPLVDVLQDEDLTFLDLDVQSCNIARLSAGTVRQLIVDAPAERPLPAEASALRNESQRDLNALIDVWPRLSIDLQQAILCIAREALH